MRVSIYFSSSSTSQNDKQFLLTVSLRLIAVPTGGLLPRAQRPKRAAAAAQRERPHLRAPLRLRAAADRLVRAAAASQLLFRQRPGGGNHSRWHRRRQHP